MYQRLLLSFLLGFTLSSLFGQQGRFVPGELLVQLPLNEKAQDWLKYADLPSIFQFEIIERVSKPANIWLLRCDPALQQAALDQLQKDSRVIAQLNHFVESRGLLPDDPLINSQWQYVNTGQSGGTVDADLDMDDAWELSTGGLTLRGDTIVVAVLDNGINLNHPDLQRNRWVNHAEIPNNNIDDDNNGYVDDYLGWSIVSDSDDISGGGHGTPVAGIIGADGNNGLGVSGVNWYVKVMIIRNDFNTTEAKVLEAYSYALEQRMRYNASAGAEGAFVVATNASWGANEAFPDEAPLWCGFYDLLGQHGILNCGATSNNNVDVDVVGDLPTTCTSEYLLSVTNMNRNNQKHTPAGYGTVSIDLGAYGQETYTLSNSGGYAPFGGTSGATPHVAGAIAYLYSLNCPNLMALLEADPAATALAIRRAILDGVTPNPALAAFTATSGHLNIYSSALNLLEACDGCLPASSVRVEALTDTRADLLWNSNDSLVSVALRWRQLGAPNWNLVAPAVSPVMLTGLQACTEYEYQLQSHCARDTVFFGESRIFKTDGCCEAPRQHAVTAVAANSASLSWSGVLAATNYELRYRAVGSTEWTSRLGNNLGATVQDLETCQDYEYQLRVICAGNQPSEWGNTGTFRTSGCGPCLDLMYCTSDNLSTDEEYISRVQIGSLLDNSSQGSPDGYVDFGGIIDAPRLEQGANYTVTLTPGFTGQTYQEGWTVWMDLNHDGFFASSEIVLNLSPSSMAASGQINIPANARLGITRMRVLMQFASSPSPCPIQDGFGEIEDYCVEIVPTSDCAPPDILLTDIEPNGAVFIWPAVAPALSYVVEFRSSDDLDWSSAHLTGTTLSLTGLDTCQQYTVRGKSVCFDSESTEYSSLQFNSFCMTSANELPLDVVDWHIFPNPVRDNLLQIEWNSRLEDVPSSVIIHDVNGRAVLASEWPSGAKSLRIDLNSLVNGIYIVQLTSAKGFIGKKSLILKM